MRRTHENSLKEAASLKDKAGYRPLKEAASLKDKAGFYPLKEAVKQQASERLANFTRWNHQRQVHQSGTH